MAMLDLEDALIIQGQNARIISSKIWEVLITLSIISDVIGRLVSSIKYGISSIFKYDFN